MSAKWFQREKRHDEESDDLIFQLYRPGLLCLMGTSVLDEDEHSALVFREILQNYAMCEAYLP